MGPIRKRDSLTTEEQVAVKKRALRRFRKIGRLAYQHSYWLGEYEETQISDNVRRNILMLTKKKKILSTLTMYDKSILRKPTEWRTDEEKNRLSKVIGGLKCFRKYPPEVKSALAGITYFLYYPPNRIVVKQNHEPSGMYFILAGEASVTVSHYDKYLHDWIPEETGVLGPGTTFGEFSLLHEIKRLATISTITHTELLMIPKDDFRLIIKDTILKVWNEIQLTLARFTYFKNWDQLARRECSMITKIKSYNPDEVIFGDNNGLSQYVYFISKGSCCLIENIKIRKCKRRGAEYYYLAPIEFREQDQESTITLIMNRYRKFLELDDELWKLSTSNIAEEQLSKLFQAKLSETSRHSQVTISKPSSYFEKDFDKHSSVSAASVSVLSRIISEELHLHDKKSGASCGEKTYFIKVCDMSEGACFNIGETFDRRRIMATTAVTCLLIPRYWIMRHNQDGIWNRVLQYLNQHIPSTEEIFKRFVQQQNFKKYSKKLVGNLLKEKLISTDNSLHNVPYNIRMKDGTDTDYFN